MMTFPFNPTPCILLPLPLQNAEPNNFRMAQAMGLTTDLHPQPLGCAACGTFIAVKDGLCAICADDAEAE
jgi:hypothetical protein